MRHARKDYERFQDPEGKVPKDEPVFILRAQDMFAAQTVQFYAKMCADNGLQDMAIRCRDWALEMAQYQPKDDAGLPGKKKLPDVPEGS